MAVSTEHPDHRGFPRPLPYPVFFMWATWVVACVFAYWTYYQAARPNVSLRLSAIFWGLTLVVIPVIVHRSGERMAGVVTAMLALIACALLMQGAVG